MRACVCVRVFVCALQCPLVIKERAAIKDPVFMLFVYLFTSSPEHAPSGAQARSVGHATQAVPPGGGDPHVGHTAIH